MSSSRTKGRSIWARNRVHFTLHKPFAIPFLWLLRTKLLLLVDLLVPKSRGILHNAPKFVLMAMLHFVVKVGTEKRTFSDRGIGCLASNTESAVSKCTVGCSLSFDGLCRMSQPYVLLKDYQFDALRGSCSSYDGFSVLVRARTSSRLVHMNVRLTMTNRLCVPPYSYSTPCL